MKDKDYIFCLFTLDSPPEKIIDIYGNYIDSIIRKYKKFTIINFYRYSQKKIVRKNYEKYLRKRFKKKINFFYPENKNKFYKFIENKQIFALDVFGKNFKDFKLRYLINKKNIFIILLINGGYLSNEKKGVLELSLKNKVFLFLKNLNKLIYRVLIILNIFPKTFLYIDSRKSVVDKFHNSKIRNIVKKFSSLHFLINFLNVYRINSNAYKKRLSSKKIINNNKIIFIDGNYNHTDLTEREQLNFNKIKIDYFNLLTNTFLKLETTFKKKVEICLHPTSNFKIYKKNFGEKFKLSSGKTSEKILSSNMIIMHESSLIIDALILNKKIVLLQTNILGNYFLNKILMYKHLLKLPTINLDSKKILSKKEIINQLLKTKKHRDQYVKANLIYNNELPSVSFVNIIENLIKKNNL